MIHLKRLGTGLVLMLLYAICILILVGSFFLLLKFSIWTYGIPPLLVMAYMAGMEV